MEPANSTPTVGRGLCSRLVATTFSRPRKKLSYHEHVGADNIRPQMALNRRIISAPTTRLTLGIDTSTSILDVAIFNSKGEIIASFTSNEEKTHSERAMVAVDNVLKQANLTIDDIDIFAACIGPGSYTGVRIGVSIAKGLALATGKPALGISSLDLIAHNFAIKHPFLLLGTNDIHYKKYKKKKSLAISTKPITYYLLPITCLIAPIIDARRGAVFTATYKNGIQITPSRRIDLDELKNELDNTPHHLLSTIDCPLKWQGITPAMLDDINIIYLGGSV